MLRERNSKGVKKCHVSAMSECVKNILNGNISLSARKKDHLRPYTRQLRQLANRSVNLKSKRKVLQRGGFLGALAGILVPVLSDIIGKIF